MTFRYQRGRLKGKVERKKDRSSLRRVFNVDDRVCCGITARLVLQSLIMHIVTAGGMSISRRRIMARGESYLCSKGNDDLDFVRLFRRVLTLTCSIAISQFTRTGPMTSSMTQG